MVASRTALIVGGITLPTGLILTIVGAAYYGDSYSTCNSGTDAVDNTVATLAAAATGATPSRKWCQLPGANGAIQKDYIYESEGDAWDATEIFVEAGDATTYKALNSPAAKAKYGLVCNAHGTKYCGPMLDNDCKLRNVFDGKLFASSAVGAGASQLTFYQFDGSSDIEVAAQRQLQTAVQGSFRKLSNLLNDTMKKGTDLANDACDADFAAMVAMCVIGSILMVVGLAFFVIWGKYSSDA